MFVINKWVEERKMGAAGAKGEKMGACHPPSTQQAPFLCSTLFSTTRKLFPTHSVCMCVCLSEYMLEVRFGAGAIKALLKHF